VAHKKLGIEGTYSSCSFRVPTVPPRRVCSSTIASNAGANASPIASATARIGISSEYVASKNGALCVAVVVVAVVTERRPSAVVVEVAASSSNCRVSNDDNDDADDDDDDARALTATPRAANRAHDVIIVVVVVVLRRRAALNVRLPSAVCVLCVISRHAMTTRVSE
jgi:hypothetical protein